MLYTPLKSMWYMKLGIHFECIFFEENTFLWIFGRFWEKSLKDCVSNNLRALDYQRIENWSSLLFITDREELRRSASWTLSGIVLPEDRSRGRTKPSLSKRMKTLVESQKRRILVFRNGESSEGVEIVAGRFDEVYTVDQLFNPFVPESVVVTSLLLAWSRTTLASSLCRRRSQIFC